jgi:hypothetical protein
MELLSLGQRSKGITDSFRAMEAGDAASSGDNASDIITVEQVEGHQRGPVRLPKMGA